MNRVIIAILLLGFSGCGAIAAPISVTPCADNGATCFHVDNISALDADDVEAIVGTSYQYDLLYKFNTGSNTGDGSFADHYNTTHVTSEGTDDYTGMDINHDGGSEPAVACPECWLVVRDGDHDSRQYLISLASWDGVATLALSGFWPGEGAISHAAIFGASVVPVPAAIWLFGTALIGFIGFSRRTRV